MANLMFLMVTMVTVSAEVSSKLEAIRNPSISQVLKNDFAENGVPEAENQPRRGNDSSVVPSLDKYASTLLNTMDLTKTEGILERIKDLVNFVKDKREHTQTFDKSDYKRNADIAFRDTTLPLSTEEEEVGLKSIRETRNHAATSTNDRLNGAIVNFGAGRVFPFQVAVVVSKPKGPIKNSLIFVPLTADMTVIDAFVAATRNYMDLTASKPEDVPFNVVLDWNNKLKCYVVIKAVGIENKRKQAWFFTVRDIMNKTQYRNRCLPDDDVILRPMSSVQLTYRQIKRRS